MTGLAGSQQKGLMVSSPPSIQPIELVMPEKVAETLGLPEKGNDSTKTNSSCNKGTHIATGYRRIVYGDHGPYVEFDKSQIVFESFPISRHKRPRLLR